MNDRLSAIRFPIGMVRLYAELGDHDEFDRQYPRQNRYQIPWRPAICYHPIAEPFSDP